MSLFAWLTDPPDDRGIHIASATIDEWDFTPYPRLAELTWAAARRLRQAGVERGDVVVLVRWASVEFVADFFATLVLGATPTAVAPPRAFRDRAAYTAHLERIIRLVGARVLSTSADVAAQLASLAHAQGCAVVTEIADEPVAAGTVTPPEVGLIQFSSGSTSAPKGIRISFEALQGQLSTLSQWMQLTPRDRHVSWMPLHHDMGLVGQLLAPMNRTADVWLMRPDQFVRSPSRWLRRLGEGVPTGAVTPPFGLAHVVRRVRPADVAGLDLSNLRFVIVGAERIEDSVLEAFLRLLEPCGLRREVLLPSYGLAEATLAVTGTSMHGAYPVLDVDPASLVIGERVASAMPDSRRLRLVGCGTPLSGMSVRVVDDDGHTVGDDMFGEIEIGGVSLADGYIGEDGAEDFAGTLRTGDAGFVRDGQLYVVGRLGESVKQFGAWLFAEDAERCARNVANSPQRTVALLGVLEGRNTAAVLVEGGIGDAAPAIGQAVVEGTDGLRVQVYAVPPGTIIRTTSGKLKRQEMWLRLIRGEMGGSMKWDSDPVTEEMLS
ncbi:AMP-binding protein [Micromonospora pallida]|uniref:AMP-binding protein n=1 Tax=Micromonospora pallida TaxID=145854 RepID=UPI00159F0656|nr:AMP-binding protein [Micromonospora pallida]